MTRRRPSMLRWIAGVAFAALLLKAAVPLFAATAADAQGRAVADICSVWGVKLPQPAAAAADEHAHHHHDPASDDAPTHGSDKPHGGEHCALIALAALATPADAATQPAPPATPATALALPAAQPRGTLPDAEAAWFAHLKHGPPAA